MLIGHTLGSWELPAVTMLLAAGLVLLLAGLLLGGQSRDRGGGPVCPNPSCGYHNPSNARYCAHCGRELPAEPRE